jgi:ABC-type bacteriocin/lantibiotic exporter with double-glycine peptidase domain
MKLVNDMVTGIRTIKCYGWEQHYINKINEVRDKQLKILVKINIISTLGISVF